MQENQDIVLKYKSDTANTSSHLLSYHYNFTYTLIITLYTIF